MINRYFEIMTDAEREKAEEFIEDVIRRQPSARHSFLENCSKLMTSFHSGGLVASCEPDPENQRYERAFPEASQRIAAPKTRISVGDSDVYGLLGVPSSPNVDQMQRNEIIATEIFRLLVQQRFNTHLYRVDETRHGLKVTKCQAKNIINYTIEA